jgi:nucleoside-diphosphate-sugar epimerase
MKVFVAGATGVLGRRVIPGLLSTGHEVVGLSRSPENDRMLGRLGAEARTGDLFDGVQMRDISADCEAILHLATAIPAVARPSGHHWLLNDRIRREGTANLVAAALQNRCRLYVQQSVTFLYGDRNGEWVDETFPIATRQPAMLQSAVDMERLVLDASTDRLPAVILRFGSFYAHDSSQTSEMFRAVSQRRFPIMGKGDVYWNIINIDDAADAVVRAVLNTHNRPANILNICDDEPVLYRDFVNQIADALHVARPRTLPKIAARVALGSDLSHALLGSVRCKNGKAKTELGWQPKYRTFREGIPAEIAKWSSQLQTTTRKRQ